jgi:hypothetical protein
MNPTDQLPPLRELPPNRSYAARRQLEGLVARSSRRRWSTKRGVAGGAILGLAITGGAVVATASGPSKGGVADPGNGRLNLKDVPDFISVSYQGKVVGYVPRADVFNVNGPNKPVTITGAPAPVYKSNLSTLVGHLYPGIGYVPLGQSPTTQPCVNEFTIAGGNGTTTTSTVPCPSTVEVVPDVIGVYLPTAMGDLSATGLSDGVDIVYVNSTTVPSGHVVSINPTPGTKVSARSEIKIVSSIGPATTSSNG